MNHEANEIELHEIVYVSSAVGSWDDSVLENILEISRRNNDASDITGMLLYCDGGIIQALQIRFAKR